MLMHPGYSKPAVQQVFYIGDKYGSAVFEIVLKYDRIALISAQKISSIF